MTERWGTIFECGGKKAIRHRVPQSSWQTVCKLNLYNKIPENWNSMLKAGWNIEHDLPKEIRCPKCYPRAQTPKRRKAR